MDCSALVLDSVLPSKKEKLQKAFGKLEDQRAALTSCMLQWREVEEYLAEAERDLQKRHGELCEKEKAFETRVKEAEEILDRREETLADKEQRVQELKESALAALLGLNQRLAETVGSAKKDAIAAFNAIAEDHLTNMGKESVSMQNVGISPSEQKDLAGEKAEEVCNSSFSLKECSSITVKGCSSSSSFSVKKCSSSSSLCAKECSSSFSGKECSNGKEASSSSCKSSDVKLRLHLKEFCEKMDGEGLLKYMVERRKDVNGLRNELPLALRSANEPAGLVLDSLDGYCFVDHPGATTQGEKKESRISANRRACILLLECLGHVLDHPTSGLDSPVVTSSIKERAKAMADHWESKMNLEGEALASNSLDAQAFLQLLGTFGVASEYKKDELCKLVTAVARRRQTPALCRSLGLTGNISDIVDRLASDGKQVEAISLAHAFGIMDHIQPGPLLKAYLKEAKKSAQFILKSGLNTPAALNDSTTKELTALKNVLKCIEEFELESQFPSPPLQKRVLQLEKTKLDRKRVAVAVKAQAKRPRANTGNSLSHAPPERTFHRPLERPQYGSMGLASYSIAMTNSFDRRNQGNYGSAYASGNRTPVALPASYLYAADGLPSPVYGSAAYANPSANYGSYQFGSGLPPPAPAYPTPFLH